MNLQWDGGEDKADADQAGAEAGGGTERQSGTQPSQGGETSNGAGKHEAETQVRRIHYKLKENLSKDLDIS